MKYVLYLFTAVSLLAAKGCPSRGPSSPRALLLAESTLRESPFEPSGRRRDDQGAIAKVISHAGSSRFRAEVAGSLGVSADMVGKVVLQRKAETRLVEVRAELSDRELAAKVVNAVASRLEEDFRNNRDVTVKVVGTAQP